MLDKIRKRMRIFLGIVITLLPVIVVARIVIVVKFIDPQTLFYERNTVIPDIFNYIVYTLSVAALFCGFLFRIRFAAGRPRLKRNVTNFSAPGISDADIFDFPEEPEKKRSEILRRFEKKPDSPELNGATRLIFENTASSAVFASTLTGFIFIASALLICAGMIMENRFGAINCITLIASIFSGCYFLLSGMKNIYPYARPFGYLSMMPCLWCVFRLISDFLDLSQNSNEYSHILQIACLVFLTLFFFNEGKFTLTNPAYYSFGFYIGSAAAALIIIATVSVPNLLLASFWMVDFNTDVFNSLVEFTVGVYIIAKLFAIQRKLDKMTPREIIAPGA